MASSTGTKFDRNYVLSVQTQTNDTLTIKLPFTVEFDITRNILSSANVGSIRIYNLAKDKRNLIRKNVTDYGNLRLIRLQAGYGNNLSTIFTGNITQAWSAREGVNFITSIESFDGGFAFANGITNETFPADTPQEEMISQLLNNLKPYGVSPGAIGNFAGILSRPNSFSGPTTDIIRAITGGASFIDNGKMNCLKDDECLVGDLKVIDAASGLLGTPIREQTIINFDVMFEPRIIVGQLIELKSATDANFNGTYKVISVKHRGMISGAVCGDAVTSVGLFAGVQSFKTVTP